MEIGRKVTDFPDEIQRRLVSLYVMQLQPELRQTEGGDGFRNPVMERLVQGIMES